MDYQEVNRNTQLPIRPMRIGNIEFRLAKSLAYPSEDYVDIICWYPNSYYGREKDFIKDGEFYIDREYPSIRTHESCFKNKESCYTVATIDIEEEPDVCSVGLRAFNLSEEEYKNFLIIVKLAYQYAHELWSEQQDY